MLKSIKARISIAILGFLILCGSVVCIMRTFADTNYLIVSPLVGPEDYVELDGTNDGEFYIRLVIPEYDSYDIQSMEGIFSNNSPYIMASECSGGPSGTPVEAGCNPENGRFFFEYEDFHRFTSNQMVYTMHFTVSPDTPAGVYTMPINITSLRAQQPYAECEFVEDCLIDEHMIISSLEAEITVKRPHEVVFEDSYGNPLTEITKYYGDDDFIIRKRVSLGDGDIVEYYLKDSDGESVAEIIDGTDYIHINGVGSVDICAFVPETNLYLETDSCFTVNVEKRPVLLHTASVRDKNYDGTTEAELDSITFYQDTIEEPGYYIPIEIDPSYYNINVYLDEPNAGERWATVEFAWSEEGDKYYTLISESSIMVRVNVNPAYLDVIDSYIESKVYDPGAPFQYLDTAFFAPFLGQYISLDEGIDFELLWEGLKVYDEVWLKDADDYDITVSPLEGSNYTFEPFLVNFTIEPMELEVYSVEVDDKTYDRTNVATVSGVTFSDNSLVRGRDYEAYATLDDYSAGTWDGQARIELSNTNYYFYSEYPDYDDYNSYGDYDDRSDHTYFSVYGVEIFPLELTDDNTYYSYEDNLNSFVYTGSELRPNISMYVIFGDGDQREDVELVLNDDYQAEYPEDSTNVGTKQITVTGTGNYFGTVSPIEYYITPYLLENLSIMTPAQTYSGEAFEPEPAITATFNGSVITVPTSDYIIMDHHDAFIDAGDYTYLITKSQDGNFYLSDDDSPLQAGFTINPYEISSSNVSLNQSTYKHNGTSQTPSVTVSVGGIIIDENDYDVAYSDDTIGNDESDTVVTVTVTAKEDANISGSASTTYVITPRDVLTIAGIDDNQQIEYTGSPVALQGNVMVEENPAGIVADDLTVTWYASDGTTVINQPTNAGSYKVVYSYEDSDYCGKLVINFEITKAESPYPAETETNFKIAAGQTLADLEGERTTGFAWTDSETVVTRGNNVYTATYAYNGDSENYETLSLNIPVYGLAHVHVNVTESEGGAVILSNQDVLEEETITITIVPESGHVLNSIVINGVDYTNNVDADMLSIVAGTEDIEIVATFAQIYYEVIEGAEQIFDLDKDDVATFRINADYELFDDGGIVYVDDEYVAPENYTSWDGSTYIEFTNDYLSTLSIGTHTLKIVFNDGGISTTTFTITKSDDGGSDSGDEEHNNDDAKAPDTGYYVSSEGGSALKISFLAIMVLFPLVLRKIRR